MKDLVIVGAGDFGREVYDWANATGSYRIKGFLDDTKPVGCAVVEHLKVLSSIDDFDPGEFDYCVVSISNPRSRKAVAEKLTKKGAKFASVVHPSAIISSSAAIGEGTVICPQVIISSSARVGKHVILNTRAGVGHDVDVGDYSTLCSFVDLTGYVVLGEGVFVGSHAVVAPKCKVGAFVRISACSFVTRSISDECTVFGVPAKRLSGIS